MTTREEKLKKVLEFVVNEVVYESEFGKYHCLACRARPISSLINKPSKLEHEQDCPITYARDLMGELK